MECGGGECGEAGEISGLTAEHVAAEYVAAIYVVQLTAADGEYFTKVGITSKYDPEASNPFEGLAARARGFYPYKVTACEVRVGTPEKVSRVEVEMLQMLSSIRNMRYTPQVSFNGSKKECFRLAYNKMKLLLEERWELVDAADAASVAGA